MTGISGATRVTRCSETAACAPKLDVSTCVPGRCSIAHSMRLTGSSSEKIRLQRSRATARLLSSSYDVDSGDSGGKSSPSPRGFGSALMVVSDSARSRAVGDPDERTKLSSCRGRVNVYVLMLPFPKRIRTGGRRPHGHFPGPTVMPGAPIIAATGAPGAPAGRRAGPESGVEDRPRRPLRGLHRGLHAPARGREMLAAELHPAVRRAEPGRELADLPRAEIGPRAAG